MHVQKDYICIVFAVLNLKLNSLVISYQPTGRAIQVEAGYGERLPSIDTRPPRIRDSDAIIEVLYFKLILDRYYTDLFYARV